MENGGVELVGNEIGEGLVVQRSDLKEKEELIK